MNLKEPFRSTNGFTEVIQASLAGNVYFWDLATGKPTREPIKIGNPIKGSVAVHPNGIPILYVGDGIREKAQPGFRLFNLIDGKLLKFFPTDDSAAYRRWPGNDCSALFNSASDTLIVASENGLFHRIDLGTKWNPETGSLSLSPTQVKFRYKSKTTREQGIENSVAVYKNLAYFTNNGGDLVCLDATTGALVWQHNLVFEFACVSLVLLHHTRLECIIGSTAFMRAAFTQALHHVQYRRAFQRRLIDQPLMRAVVAELAVEWEAAALLMLRAHKLPDRVMVDCSHANSMKNYRLQGAVARNLAGQISVRAMSVAIV